MSLYDLYGTDQKKERDAGVEVEFPEGVRMWIRRAGGSNTRFERALDAVMKPYRRQIQQNLLEEGKARELEARVYARAVIIDWEGVTDEKGNVLDCTEENIVKLFTDLPDLFTEIKQQAQELANFRLEQREADRKNSKTRSTTS